jgi:uncharacterized membrane protein YsdA (DUF1294 family)/cold shock CspA family protein
MNRKEMRTKGKIISWNDEKGFGFVKPNNNKKQVFVHIKSFTNRKRRPEINQSVFYSEASDNPGRPRAVNVDFVGDKKIKTKRQSSGTTSIFVAIIFLIIVCVTVFIGAMSPFILGLYVIASFATFLWYAKDKAAAQNGNWRTPESTLHLMSLLGGWPGALIAQQKLRHKSKKQSFRIVFWITVLLNCGGFIWLFTPDGSATLHSLTAIIKIG